MKLVTGGIGVDSVSITPSAIAIYGNEAFFNAYNGTPGHPALKLAKVCKRADGWDIYLTPSASEGTLPSMIGDRHAWRRKWTANHKKPSVLPIGGRTPILDLTQLTDGTLVVSIPQKLIQNGKVGQVRSERKGSPLSGTASPPTYGLADLSRAVQCVNALQESLGDQLELEIIEGRLRARMVIG